MVYVPGTNLKHWMNKRYGHHGETRKCDIQVPVNVVKCAIGQHNNKITVHA